MRGSSAWSCSSCVVLLFSAFWGQDVAVSASHAGRQHQVNRDVIHRVAKAQVTAMAVLKRQEGDGGGLCATDHSLCPQSLSGGCCPNRYSCAVDSCVATTAGPASGCGMVGFYPCADGGCCRVGFICGKNQECFPPASVTLPATSCPNNYSLCPSSVNFGCCKSGMGCAVNGCYSTNPVTSTVTRTESFTSGTRVLTTTTTATFVATPTPPTGVPTAGGPDGEAKFIPTSVPKVPARNSGSGSGLSGGAIGGIVAGVVIVLIVVVVAAFLIIRKLNKVVEVTESKKSASDKHTATKKSASQIQQMEIYGRDLHSPAPYADDFGNDPLYITNNSTPQPDGAAADSNRQRSDSNPGGFTPSPNMFHDPRSTHASPDFNVGFFDHPGSALINQNNMNEAPMQPARIRSSTDSNNRERGYQYTHWRQQSNASELSADGSDHGHHSGVNSPLVIPELEASRGFAELPGQGQGHEGTRSRSGSAPSRPHNRQRSDTQQSRSELGLSPLDEEVEIHGFYGRRDQQAGQTAAGLEELDWDVSSPVIPGYIPSSSPPQPQEPQHGYYSPYTPQPPPK